MDQNNNEINNNVTPQPAAQPVEPTPAVVPTPVEPVAAPVPTEQSVEATPTVAPTPTEAAPVEQPAPANQTIVVPAANTLGSSQPEENNVMPNVNPNTMMTPVETEIQTEAPEKSKKKGNPILLLLLLVIVAGGGYYAYNTFLGGKAEPNTSQTEKTDKEDKEKVEELTEEELTSYLEDATPLMYRIADKVPLKTSSLDNATVLWYAAVVSFDDNNVSGLAESFTQSSLDTVVTRVFGKDFKYTHESINCFAGDGVLYEYNKDKEVYTKNALHGHGGEGATRLKIYAINSSKTKDKIEITTKILYAGRCQDVCGPIVEYYSDAAGKNSVYKVENEEAVDQYDTVYEKVKDKLPETTFVYTVQSDGNYGLSEIKN